MLYTCDPSITAAFLKLHWTMLGVYQYLVYWYMCCVHIWTSLYFSIFEKVSTFISEISLCNVVTNSSNSLYPMFTVRLKSFTDCWSVCRSWNEWVILYLWINGEKFVLQIDDFSTYIQCFGWIIPWCFVHQFLLFFISS